MRLMVQHLKTHLLDMVKNDAFPSARSGEEALHAQISLEQVDYQRELLQPQQAADEKARSTVSLGGTGSLEDMMNNSQMLLRTQYATYPAYLKNSICVEI